MSFRLNLNSDHSQLFRWRRGKEEAGCQQSTKHETPFLLEREVRSTLGRRLFDCTNSTFVSLQERFDLMQPFGVAREVLFQVVKCELVVFEDTQYFSVNL